MFRYVVLILLLVIPAVAQTPPTNFEPSLVHPIAVSPSGHLLFVLNSAAGTLEVFSLEIPEHPVGIMTIPVGVAPVSLRARTDDEVWVVDSVSDAVSVVSISAASVQRIISVKDDPADVIFAGTPERAFISVGGSDEVRIFDPLTGNQVGTVAIFGKEPRAMAATPSGDRVYVAAFRSGNKTSILPDIFAPLPPLPTNPTIPPAPRQGQIIDLSDPAWSSFAVNLPDTDLFVIDTSTLMLTGAVAGVGTINYDLIVAPDRVVVANTNAQNLIDFEPALKGRFYESRLTGVSFSGLVLGHFDLNADIDTSSGSDEANKHLALSEPVSLLRGHDGYWVAAQGSDRVAFIEDSEGAMTRIDLRVDEAPGSGVAMRGPRGLALHPGGDVLYVLNRLSHTIAVIDAQQKQHVFETELGADPMNASWRRGMGHLYDARLSGNGTVSCASCHVDGESDLLAWNLGDPSGNLEPVLPQPVNPAFPPNSTPPFFYHPMKGPMLTQSLRGLAGTEPFHWRGDRAAIQDFNGAFDVLLGGRRLDQENIDMLADAVLHISHPGNPHQNLDRTYSSAATTGEISFNTTTTVNFLGTHTMPCSACHSLPSGSGPNVLLPIPETFIAAFQPVNVPNLAGLYRRGTVITHGPPSKVGFGFGHDGVVPSLRDFMDVPSFTLLPESKKGDLAKYLNAFDTGTAPIVGQRVYLDASNATSPSLTSLVALMETRALAQDCDLLAEVRIDGRRHSLFFDAGATLWKPVDVSSLVQTTQQLLFSAATSRLTGSITAMPFRSGLLETRRSPAQLGRSREVPPPSSMSPIRLESVARGRDAQGRTGFSVINLPAGATAELFWESGTGRTSPTTNGSWLHVARLAGNRALMTANGNLATTVISLPATGGMVTVQARITPAQGPRVFTNALFVPAR